MKFHRGSSEISLNNPKPLSGSLAAASTAEARLVREGEKGKTSWGLR